jgi:hypothetical protein
MVWIILIFLTKRKIAFPERGRHAVIPIGDHAVMPVSELRRDADRWHRAGEMAGDGERRLEKEKLVSLRVLSINQVRSTDFSNCQTCYPMRGSPSLTDRGSHTTKEYLLGITIREIGTVCS